jgi:hypothetical protein
LLEMGWAERSPSLRIIMFIPFLSLMILSLSIVYYSALSFLKKIKFMKS